MRQSLDEKLQAPPDRRYYLSLQRMATIAAVLALLASVVLIVVGTVSLAGHREKPKAGANPVAATLASNESRTQAEKELEQWRSQIIDGGGRLNIHGAGTTAAGDVVRFDGRLLVSTTRADGNGNGIEGTQIEGVVEAVLRRSRRGHVKGEWQPLDNSFTVAMRGGAAYVWKSVVDRSGDKYPVSDACVSPAKVPTFARVAIDALLLPANWRESELSVERAFSPAVDRQAKSSNSSKENAIRLSITNESFDLWQLRRDYESDSAGENDSASSSLKPERKIWILIGGNTSMSLRLEVDRSEEIHDAVVVSAMMLANYQRAFRSCTSLTRSISPSMDGKIVTTNAPRRVEESVPAIEAFGKPVESQDAGVPLPLRKIADKLRSSKTASESLVMPIQERLPVEPLSSTTECDGDKKKCLFVHGIGVRKDVGLVGKFTGYWGEEVLTTLPCCSELKFTHFNTVDRPWYSPTLARATCDAAAAVTTNETFHFPSSSNSSGDSQRLGPLRDLVIVSHSSGVMNVATALMLGYCSLSPNSSKWIAIEGPVLGSNTANHVVDDCDKPASAWDRTVKTVLSTFDLCPPSKATKSFVRNGTDAIEPCLDELYTRAAATFRANVNASLCGVSAKGIPTSDSAYYLTMAAYSDHENPDENDGAVSFDSCRGGLPASKYNATFQSAFYKAALNHADGRLIHGNGWGEDQQPMRWLQRQIK